MHVHAAAIHGGDAFRVESLADDGLDEYILQFAAANKWVEVSVAGTRLTIQAAQRVAESAGASSP